MRKFRIKIEDKIYEVEIEEIGGNEKSGGIITPLPSSSAKAPQVETKPEAVKMEKKPVESTPKSSVAVTGEEVVAPMPGKILQLKVKEGDQVKEGNALLILEAMKMENEIIANSSGTVKKINVAINDMVDTGDVLMVIG